MWKMAPPTEAECLCIPQPALNEVLPNIGHNSLCTNAAKNLCEKINQMTLDEKKLTENDRCKTDGHQHGQWLHPKYFHQMNRLKSIAFATNSLELLDR